MSLFHLATALPSGMSRAIKALDTESATRASQNMFTLATRKLTPAAPTDLANDVSRLTYPSMDLRPCENYYNVFISRTSEIVNALSSLLERRAAYEAG